MRISPILTALTLAALLYFAANPVPVAGAAPLNFDRQGRPTTEAIVNGQGPFRFVVDTAAHQRRHRAGVPAYLIPSGW